MKTPHLIARLAAIVVLVALLIAVRYFENSLFYDPLLHYYRSNFQNKALPEIDAVQLLLSYGFRYSLNGVLSLAIIYFTFNSSALVRFSVIAYLILFTLLASAFFLYYHYHQAADAVILFYIRRMLIQPIFLLLFVAGFFYQQRQTQREH